MATLANLVKNIDPPVEITQEEYNNLTEEQKNDGTVYYIVDGSSSFQTAATTPAEASDGTGSNVQAELDKRLEISKLVNGGTATQAGYALDARYGKTLADQVNQLDSRLDDNVQRATLDSTYYSTNRLSCFRYAQNATNNPHSGNSGFCLEMWLSTTSCIQLAVSAEPSYYVRRMVSGAWSDWLDLNSRLTAIEPIIVTVAANSSETISGYTASNSDRRLLAVGNSSNTALQGLYLFLSSSIVIPLVNATGLTVTVSNGKITIANSTGSTASGVLLV